MGFWLFAFLALAGPARADRPADDLSFSEKQAMPAWMFAQYVSDRRAAGVEASTVVRRYRRIVEALGRLPEDRKRDFIDQTSRAEGRERRDQLVNQFLGLPTRAPPDSSLPRDELTDFERLGQLPDWLEHDYRADLAASADPVAVTERYRRIISSYNGLSAAGKREFDAKAESTTDRAARDEVVAAWTGVRASDAPVKTIHLGNDNADLTITMPQWHPDPRTSVGVDLKTGMLAPMGGTGDQNSVLKESPYVQAAFTGAYDGSVHALTMMTGAAGDLNSGKALFDPTGQAASNAGRFRSQQDFSQTFVVGSVYSDVGTTARFGDQLSGAFYAAGDAFVYRPTAPGAENQNPAVPVVSLTAGTMWMVRWADNDVSAYTDLRMRGVSTDTKVYGSYTVAPAVASGVEYAHHTSKTDGVTVGAEGVVRTEDASVRPYVSVRSGDVDALAAGDFRQSRDEFAPSAAGGGAKLGWQATPFMKVGVQGSLEDQRYPMAPSSELAYTGMTTLDFDLDRQTRVKTAFRAPDRYPESEIIPSAARLNESVTQGPYDKVDFLDALKKSNSMSQFAEAVGAQGVDEILSALSAASASLNRWNYAHSNDGWAGSDDQIYASLKTGVLKQTQTPSIQCVGGETFIASLAEELGRQSGVPIEAHASSVEVPDANGVQSTHFVAMVKTEKYGIVFVDWGQLTPTYQFDTKKALAAFQALQGIPQIAHYIADARGHFGGYLFSDDGKTMVENLTYHAELPSSPVNQLFRDDPGNSSIVEGRARGWLRNDP